MNCIGIWLAGAHGEQQNPKQKEIECHFNLWILNRISHRRRANLNFFLDIGIMLSSMDESDYINIFIPDRINKSNIQDLGLAFKDKTELVSAVFKQLWSISPP